MYACMYNMEKGIQIHTFMKGGKISDEKEEDKERPRTSHSPWQDDEVHAKLKGEMNQ